MEQNYILQNTLERERLYKVCQSLTETDLKCPISNGWTVTTKLVHLAFWDRYYLALLTNWENYGFNDVKAPVTTINQAVLALSHHIPFNAVVSLVNDAALAIDKKVENLDINLAKVIKERGHERILMRYMHRQEHLDQIEQALRTFSIRPFEVQDWKAVWEILEPVFRAGETYSFAPEITEQEAYKVWIELPMTTFVALEGDDILSTYYIKPNQPALGAHVCNCGYIVAAKARGKGIASLMCEHSQQEAIKQGFRAMQYNLVVSTNTGAVRLWQKHGFEIVGRLPKAFKHLGLGYIDAYVMYKELV
jgi:ribosomal protein S18 acetylase RimI-like enzyme